MFNHIEYKSVDTQARASDVTDLGNGMIEAIVSVTNVKDNVGDIILPGAYTKSLTKRTPKGVWHHSWTDPIAKTLEIKELLPGDPLLPSSLPDGSPWPVDAGALYVKMKFNLNTDKGRNAYEDVKFFGDSQEWSIGYKVPERKSYRRNGVRYIQELDLYEYSPVLFGAMSSARTTTVKDAQLAYKSLMASETSERNPMDKMTEIKSAMSNFADAFYAMVGVVGDYMDEQKDAERGVVLDTMEGLGLDPAPLYAFYDDIDAGDTDAAQTKALSLVNDLEEKSSQEAVSVMEQIAFELKAAESDEDEEEFVDEEEYDDEEYDEDEEDYEDEEEDVEDEDEEDEEEDEEKSISRDMELKTIPLADFDKYL